MLLQAEKNVLTDLFYSKLEILNILAYNANFLVMYIGTVRLFGSEVKLLWVCATHSLADSSCN